MSLHTPSPTEPSRTHQTPPDGSQDINALQSPPSDPPSSLSEPLSESLTPVAKQGFWGTLRLLERVEFDGYDRTLSALNNGLTRAWNQASPVGWILARVRCEILQLSPHGYADAHGKLCHSTLYGLETYRPLERARFNPETIHRLLAGWDELAEKHATDKPEVAVLLGQAKQELLRALTRKHGRSVYGVLARWRYEVGPERFEALSGYAYKTMWQRQKAGTTFEFGELLSIGRKLEYIKAEECPPTLWQNPRVQELEDAWMFDSKKLDRPKEVSRLYKIVEACGLKVNRESIQLDAKIKLQTIVVDALNRFEMVSWKKVQPLFGELHARGSITESEYRQIKDTWRSQWNRRPETFERRLRSIRDERGLTNSQLADALGLMQQDAQKPILPVFRVLSYGEGNKHAPFGELAHLIGRSEEEVESLLQQKRNEILAQWKRQGSAITSPLAVERELWCKDYTDLPYDKTEIQKLEWGKASTVDADRVIAEIRASGEERVKEALERLLERRDLNTVQGAVSNLVALKGYAPLARLLETSVPVLKNIRDGAEVPTYPKLKSFMRLLGFEPSMALEVDWREQFARHLVAENQNDLQRVLNAYVAEHSTSRRALLQERGAHSADVARSFQWISEVGVSEPEQLAKVADTLGIPATHPTGIFLECVANEGSLVGGLTAWIQQMEQTEGVVAIRKQLSEAVRCCQRPRRQTGAIEKLREQILKFENATLGASKSSKALEVLRFLPGATIAEIAQALEQSGTSDGRILTHILSNCRSKGLTTRDIVFALRDMTVSERRPLSLLERGIEMGVASATCPPGVLAYLGAESGEQAEREVVALRKELSTRLRKFEIPGHEAVVEMMVWGIRPDDLKISSKAFARAVWNEAEEGAEGAGESEGVNENEGTISGEEDMAVEDDSSVGRIEAQAREVGLHKLRVALKELIYRRTAVLPWQLVEIAVQGMSGRDKAYSAHGGFRIGAAAQFIAGEAVPTPKQLRRTVELAELAFTDEMRLAWNESYARFLHKRNTAPLGRMLLCQIASREFDSSVMTEPLGSKTLMDNIVSAFLSRSSLPLITYRRVLHKACIGDPVKEEHLEALGAALGHKSNSPAMMVFRHLSGSLQVDLALIVQLGSASARTSALESIMRLGAFYTSEKERHDARLARGTPSLGTLVADSLHAVRPDGPAVSDLVMRASKHFIGMTKEEMLRLYRSTQDALLAQEEARKPKASKTLGLEPWKKGPELFTLPLDCLLDRIAQRLLDGKSVAIHDLLELLPRFSKLITEIHGLIGPETPRLVAAAAFYKYPDDALTEMRNALFDGKEPKYSPQEFLQTHADWVRGRGELGKLNVGTMRLNFDKPFIAPGSLSN